MSKETVGRCVCLASDSKSGHEGRKVAQDEGDTEKPSTGSQQKGDGSSLFTSLDRHP